MCPFFCAKISSRLQCCIELSFLLRPWQSLRFSFFLITFKVFRSTNQIFCRIPPLLKFAWFYVDYGEVMGFWEGKLWRLNAVLITSYQGSIYDCWCWPWYSGLRVFFKLLYYRVVPFYFFFLSTFQNVLFLKSPHLRKGVIFQHFESCV